MPKDEPTSFAHARFLDAREQFESGFERFLSRSTTPVDARRQEADETIARIQATVERLKAQGVL